MSHEAEQPLEHVEHAQHAAHDPFDRRVAMTMAVVAAVLAAVTLLSHREHNATLLNQIESSKKTTNAADQWAFYQAKKGREHLYEAMGDLASVTSTNSASKPPQAKWQANAERYKSEAESIKHEAEELEHQSE